MREYIIGFCGRIVLVLLAGISGCLAAEPVRCTNFTGQLDYWLGDWTVSSPDAPGKGHSKIYASLDGCLVTESWGSESSDHKGENVLAYSGDDNAWHGLFVDNHGRVHALEGTVAAGTAEFRESSRGDAGHTIKRVRIVRVDADHSRQIWDRSEDSGRTWTTEYRMDYLRRMPQGSD